MLQPDASTIPALKHLVNNVKNIVNESCISLRISLKISLNGKIKDSRSLRQHLFRVKGFQKIKDSFNLSLNSIVGIISAIRIAAKNKRIIEPNLKKELLFLNHNVDTPCSVEKTEFLNIKLNNEMKYKEL